MLVSKCIFLGGLVTYYLLSLVFWFPGIFALTWEIAAYVRSENRSVWCP